MYVYKHACRSASTEEERNDGKAIGLLSCLCLVSYLGVKGFDCLRYGLKTVPMSFANERELYITTVVNGLLHDNVIIPSNYQVLVRLTSSLQTTDFPKELEMLSIETKKGHTAFVSPTSQHLYQLRMPFTKYIRCVHCLCIIETKCNITSLTPISFKFKIFRFTLCT